jgi:hypothetical protein
VVDRDVRDVFISMSAFTPTPSPTPNPTSTPEGAQFKICGRAAERPGGPNNGFARGVFVELLPTDRVVQTGLTDPQFCFFNVAPGQYDLSVRSKCNIHGCWNDERVVVSEHDIMGVIISMSAFTPTPSATSN